MSEDSARSEPETDQCDRCGSEGKTTTLYRDGHVWATLCIGCHDEVSEFAAGREDESEHSERSTHLELE